MNTATIKKDMDMFQDAVKKLSIEVGKASSIWGDSKFSGLTASVNMIANMSKNVIVAGDCSCNSIDKFIKISDEKY